MARYAFITLLLLGAFALAPTRAAAQQKIAYVDIAAIMKDLPDAQDAQQMLDEMVDKWQKELDAMQKQWQDKFSDYDKRKLILTEQGRAKAEKDLQELDRRIMDFRDAKFGQTGELYQQEDRLMKPIQDMVFDQVKNLALELGYDYVFDKSGGVMIIYAKEDYDLTQRAITRIKAQLPPRATPGGQQQPGQPPQTGQQPRSTPTTTPQGGTTDQPKR
jgi:outer membrane protein